MAASQIRGSTQIQAGTITADRFVSGLNLATSQLADGASFLKRDGSVPMTAAFNAGGFKLNNVLDGTAATDAATFGQLSAVLSGLATRRVRLVANTNLTLSGLQTIDGVSGNAGDRVLLTAQTTGSQNGPWQQQSGSWTRPSDWAAASSQKSTIFFVEEGTNFHDTRWNIISDAITVDTTSETVQQDQGVAPTGSGVINVSGNVVSLNIGQGVENDGSNNLRVKLNGASLVRGSGGIGIAPGTAGQIPVTNAGATDVAMVSVSGDATMSATGALTVNNTAGSGFTKYTNFVYNETPGGSINGSNTAFTLANTPQNSSLELYYNGQLQDPGSGNDYTVSGTSITMLFAPVSGDKLRAYYTK